MTVSIPNQLLAAAERVGKRYGLPSRSAIVANAVSTATAPRPGPVHLCIPSDVLTQPVEPPPGPLPSFDVAEGPLHVLELARVVLPEHPDGAEQHRGARHAECAKRH